MLKCKGLVFLLVKWAAYTSTRGTRHNLTHTKCGVQGEMGSEVKSSHDRGSHILDGGGEGSGACNQKGGGDCTISYTPVRLEHRGE